MKKAKWLSLLLAVVGCALFALSACGESNNTENPDNTVSSNILVAYFSATGNTQKVAGYLADVTGGRLYEIEPQVPYTEADMTYEEDCRANVEHKDPAARPEIKGSVENMAEYDVIYLGYPIWWDEAPKIIYTFVESYDFSGKTIVPFCTSGSSPIGSSAANLHPLAPKATWLEGGRFPAGASKSAVEEWVNSLGSKGSGDEESEMVEEIYFTVNGRKIAVKLEPNAAAEALVELLREGDITYTASNYGGFEKVGALGRSLPRSDVRMTASAGDVMLYLGNQIVLFYGSNTWEYTKLGKMDLSAEELKELLISPDPAEVTISLH